MRNRFPQSAGPLGLNRGRSDGRVLAFTLIELLIVIGIIAVLMALLLASMEVVRHRGYIAKCAANLHTIGQALAMYANENHGNYPRTRWVSGAPLTSGTGAAASDPFNAAGAPAPNDVSAAAFWLLRSQRLPAAVFICPYNDVTSFSADEADPQLRSNFTDYKSNLSYSFADPYPDTALAERGYRWGVRSHAAAEFAIAADLNSGTPHAGLGPQSPTRAMQDANSRNHEGDGQNVLYADGHVDWRQTVFAGVNGDDIYADKNGTFAGPPADVEDGLLLPTR
jgi:prepilin-type processing-associated H-X9-DG protein